MPFSKVATWTFIIKQYVCAACDFFSFPFHVRIRSTFSRKRISNPFCTHPHYDVLDGYYIYSFDTYVCVIYFVYTRILHHSNDFAFIRAVHWTGGGGGTTIQCGAHIRTPPYIYTQIYSHYIFTFWISFLDIYECMYNIYDRVADVGAAYMLYRLDIFYALFGGSDVC